MAQSSSIAQAFVNLFSLSGLIAFVGGVVATFLYYWMKDRIADRREPNPDGTKHRTQFKSLLVLWMLVYLVVGYIALQEQYQADKIRELSANTQRCNHEFQAALKARSEAVDETDKWSSIKTKALSDWMHDLLMPPPDIAERRTVNPNDPLVQQWGLKVTAKYDGIIQGAQEQQNASLETRRQHPLPEPTCGK